jgi:hypothetical protein
VVDVESGTVLLRLPAVHTPKAISLKNVESDSRRDPVARGLRPDIARGTPQLVVLAFGTQEGPVPSLVRPTGISDRLGLLKPRNKLAPGPIGSALGVLVIDRLIQARK